MVETRFEVVLWKESKNGKKFTVRIGSATPRDDGGMNVWLDALPTPDNKGNWALTIQPPFKKRDDGVKRAADDPSVPF